MLKKLVAISVIGSSFLFGDYYSVTDVSLDSPKVIKYSDGLELKVTNSGISMNKYSKLFDSSQPKQYQDTVFTKTVKVKDPNNPDKKIKQLQTFSYPTYNFAYVLKNNPTGEFVIKTSNSIVLVKTQIDTDTIKVFNTRYNVNVYKYKIKQAYKNNKPFDMSADYILKSYVDNNGDLLAVNILDNGLDKVKKVTNRYLSQFLQEKKTRQVKVKNFSFNTQKLYASYVADKNGETKRLNVEYSKVKRYTRVVLSSPVSLLDPENKSDETIKNVGFLASARGKLWEIKKVQLLDSQPVEVWSNSLKSSKMAIIYMNGGKENRNIVFKNKGQLFYGFEGVFYLASWMKQNDKTEVILSFINGPLVFDATMKKDRNSYILTKQGRVIYQFDVDNRGFVTQIIYPSYDLDIKLDNLDNDTTIQNKQFLKQFQSSHNIKLIKD